MPSHTPSQRYLSTRGGTYNLSFESTILKGLASDGGLFIPESIPSLPSDWQTTWRDSSFQDLAFDIFSLYISRDEIPAEDLRDIVDRSYATFRSEEVTPLITLDDSKNLHLLELFHGPTFAFKDVALQFVGNLFEYFLTRRNVGKEGTDREHLTVIGATSGDTGSAAIYGLRGKKDVSVFIMYPEGKTSRVQELQMTTVPDENVHCIAVGGTFDDCQDILKTLFADPEINSDLRLAAVNSINWARILAQITYYFHSYFSLCRKINTSNPNVRFVVPTGNFGDVLAGYFAAQMGLPTEKLVVATNENDILHRFWKTGWYEKKPVHGKEAADVGEYEGEGVDGEDVGVKATLSPAMDILVSSNFERLLWFLAFQDSTLEAVEDRRTEAGEKVRGWLTELKTEGGFSVDPQILEAAKKDFESERVSDTQTIETIKSIYTQPLPDAKKKKKHEANGTATNGINPPATTGTQHNGHYILDPHSAIGVHAALRSIHALNSNPGHEDPNSSPSASKRIHHIALATAHPAKFSSAAEKALKDEEGFEFERVLPEQFVGLEEMEQFFTLSGGDWKEVRGIVVEEVGKELGLKA